MKRYFHQVGLLIGLILAALAFNGCEEEPLLTDPTEDVINSSKSGTGTFTLGVTPMVGSEVLHLNKAYYNEDNILFQMLLLRVYAANITLIKKDGSEVMIKDIDFIANYAGPDTSKLAPTMISVTVDTGEYTGIKFGLGVDSAQNLSDPAVHAIEHPLSINQSTHWNWNIGYRFMMFEARYDTMPGSTGQAAQRSITYHTGTNDLYREVSFNQSFNLVSDSEYVLCLSLDVNKILSGNNNAMILPDESFSHTTSNFQVAEKVTDNLAQAGLYKP